MNTTVNKILKGASPEWMSFFVLFSRFEYALKRNNYVQAVGRRGEVKADWDCFANDLGQEFLEQMRQESAVKVLICDPPKKQILENGQLKWSEKASKITSVQELFGAICLARNNLFHGGKYPEGEEDDTSRANDLLKDAMFILNEALSRMHNIRFSFDELPQAFR